MSCNGNVYNIGMGCCEPVLGPVENYYTKPTIDRKLEEITSAITSGCCITPEEVDEKIEEAISGITVSGVTEEQLNEAIASAKTEIEAEIPTVPTSNTAFTNDAGYLTEHQSLNGYATEQWVEDKHYITGVDLSNYATKAEIPTVPTDISAFNNDVGYITGVDLSNYATKDNLTAATDDMATKTWVNNQGYLTEHQSLTAYSTTQEVNTMITQSVSGKQDTLISGTSIKTINNESLLGSGNIIIQGGGGTDAPISAGTGTNSIKESSTGNTASGDYSHAEGNNTKATSKTAHAEGSSSTAGGWYSHAEGAGTKATGTSAHAEGYFTNAYGSYSHAEGFYTMTQNDAEHASGMYNVSNTGSSTSAKTLFSVGNGTADNARHNAFEIRQNGDVYVTSGGTDVLLQNSIVTSTEKATWNAKADIWVGDETAWGQISGSTTNGTIYLVY